ncbi:transcriptional regulator [Treponema zuelzerae]|uniref:Transcriptional regulator n=1 Tax=Teretinema zuelzerae TaxID=156 RepID=A0AAE3EFN4_9SPIR|nr:transcriptional regulator [Teretinema zuelzerae]MCD1653687.1 transcriptional regulator [Teretinema zuelzerae]
MNRIVHEQSRLKILVHLSSAGGKTAFPAIREALEMTAGNLSIQIKTLEESGYVATEKSFVENKPRTEVSITEEGREALIQYLEEMEALLAGLKAGVKP